MQPAIFFLEPRALQVLFCQCILEWSQQTWVFPQRKAPNRTPPKPEFRTSCSGALFGRDTFELTSIWFRTDYERLRRHMNTTSQLEWNSSHAGELISQCAFRKGKCIQNLQFLKYKLNQEEIWGYKKTHNNEHNQLSRSGIPAPRQITFTYYSVLSKWKIGYQWINVSTHVDPKLDICRRVIYCMH